MSDLKHIYDVYAKFIVGDDENAERKVIYRVYISKEQEHDKRIAAQWFLYDIEKKILILAKFDHSTLKFSFIRAHKTFIQNNDLISIIDSAGKTRLSVLDIWSGPGIRTYYDKDDLQLKLSDITEYIACLSLHRDNIVDDKYWKGGRTGVSTKTNYMSLTVKELRQKAADNNIVGRSKMNKAELVASLKSKRTTRAR
jgi:hypothetical protein